MKNLLVTFLLAASAVFASSCGAAEPAKSAAKADTAAPAYEPMAVFAKLHGTAWKGEGTAPDGSPVVDGAYYELIMGGRAFQSTHKLQNSDYGGRTIIFFDEGAKQYIFHYFTTAGFHTTGEIAPTESGFTAVETVNGHPKFAEVRSEAVFGDGIITVSSHHVTKDGVVSGGEGFVYRQVSRDEILLFDEADALFGKRTDVRDSHDRYANEE